MSFKQHHSSRGGGSAGRRSGGRGGGGGGRWSHITSDNAERLEPLVRKSFRKEVQASRDGTVFYRGDEHILHHRSEPVAEEGAAAAPSSAASAGGGGGGSGAAAPHAAGECERAAALSLLVSGQDCLVAATKYKNPLVGVHGSDRRVCGGYWKGTSNLQDEHITMCCPTYFPIMDALYQEVRRKQSHHDRQGPWLFDAECYYTPGVHVCRDQELNELPHIEQRVALLYMAAQRGPMLDKTECHYALVADWEGMKYKARTTYRVAKLHQHRELVLGAFGTGAYHNPAPDVIRAYLEVLDEPEFSGCFDVVDFAVLNGSGYIYDTFSEAVAEWNAYKHPPAKRTGATAATAPASVDVGNDGADIAPILTKNQKRHARKKMLDRERKAAAI